MVETHKFHFERASEETPHTEKIFLPKNIEEELLSETADSPLNLIVGRFRKANIPEQTILRYKGAVRAFMERPTEVQMSRYPAMAPQEKYFAPEIDFNTRYLPLPDLLRNTPLKPKLEKNGKRALYDKPIDGHAVLAQIEATVETKRDRTHTAPIERTLAKINRAMYAYHEAIHILQSIAPGDQLNHLKDRFPIDHLITPEKEKEYLNSVPSSGTGNLDNFHVTTKHASILAFPSPQELDSDQEISMLISNNEATMDAMQDNAISEMLKRHPETILWLHNTLTLHMKALQTLREELLAPQETTKDTLSKKEDLIAHIEFLTNFMDRAYFAAFSSSQEAQEWLVHDSKKILGRELSGAIAQLEPFDQMDILNTISDIKTLAYGYRTEQEEISHTDLFTTTPPVEHNFYTFPSGKKFLRKGISEEGKPMSSMTSHGARIAADLVGRMAEQGKNNTDLHNFFTTIQTILEDDQHDPAEELEIIRTELKNELHIDLSQDDLRELYGVADYIQFNEFGGTYYYKAFLRKRVLEELDQRAPEQVNEFIHNMFIDTPLDRNQFLIFSGFGHFIPPTDPDWKSRWELYPFEELLNGHEMGIFDINATVLEQQDKQTLHELYDRLLTDATNDYARS